MPVNAWPVQLPSCSFEVQLVMHALFAAPEPRAIVTTLRKPVALGPCEEWMSALQRWSLRRCHLLLGLLFSCVAAVPTKDAVACQLLLT